MLRGQRTGRQHNRMLSPYLPIPILRWALSPPQVLFTTPHFGAICWLPSTATPRDSSVFLKHPRHGGHGPPWGTTKTGGTLTKPPVSRPALAFPPNGSAPTAEHSGSFSQASTTAGTTNLIHLMSLESRFNDRAKVAAEAHETALQTITGHWLTQDVGF